MTTMQLRTGAEGPAYDPYHYDELTVRRPGIGTTIIHVGLGTWCKHHSADGRSLDARNEADALALFEAAVGIPLDRAMKAYRYVHDELPYKLHAKRCNGVSMSVDGMPGETLDVCQKCGSVLGYHFDRSAVE